ncbi:hypothetical protein ACFQY0_15230 [Haloferula chungangensis]|uniref:Uncharacterized protein n=1 Tax=Haloferula chungangensis TaxID=1048331 RepID=A0ABW2L843_9BACT
MRFFALLLALLLPSLAQSQDDGGESRQVVCRFLCFGSTDTPDAVDTIGPKGAKIPCPLPTKRISEPITAYAKANKIAFYQENSDKLAGTATIPSNARAAILVFVPAPEGAKSKAPWRVIVIEDSAKNFPDGGIFVANFHNDDIRFIIGEHKGALHPARTKGYARPEKRDSFNMAPVIFEFLSQDKWRVGNESALRFLPGMRYLIFAYTDPRSKRPRINTYQDFRSVAKPLP